MSYFRKLLTLLLITAISVANFLPLLAGSAVVLVFPTDQQGSQLPSTASLPAGAKPEINWATVNWDQEVVTVADQEAFLQERQELLDKGETETAVALRPARRPMFDERVLQAWAVPEAARAAVRRYREAVEENLGSDTVAKAS